MIRSDPNLSTIIYNEICVLVLTRVINFFSLQEGELREMKR